MADETNPTTDETKDDVTAAAVAEIDAAEAGAQAEAEADVKLQQTVDIKDVGPCKKHVKVTVDRGAIDKRFDEKFTELTRSDQPQVRGFRPGKAPRKMIEKQYYESVAEEIKSQVLMASLEQLAEDQTIAPLSPPEFDPNADQHPEGRAVRLRVRHRGAARVRPARLQGHEAPPARHTPTPPDEVEAEKKRLLEPYGQVVPKEPPVAALFDTITADVTIAFRDKEINKLSEVQVKVEPQLALSDGIAADFGKKMAGAKPGDVRVIDITLSQETTAEQLRGEKVQATFNVKDVKTTRPPELTQELLEESFGVSTPEAFTELVEAVLERRLEYTQRQLGPAAGAGEDRRRGRRGICRRTCSASRPARRSPAR